MTAPEIVLDPWSRTWHVRKRMSGKGHPLSSPLPQNFTLHALAARVKERAQASADVSYTRKLIDRGVAHCAKKLGEEAVETAIAAIAEDRGRLIAEAADLLYHLLVLWADCVIRPEEVWAKLLARDGISGIAEKAARSK